MKRLIIFGLNLAILNLTFASCTSDNETNFNHDSMAETESLPLQTNAIPIAFAVIAIVKIISDVTDGKYYETREYYSNGTLKKLSKGCKDTFGTCTMNTVSARSGENVSTAPIDLDDIDNINKKQINAEILNTDKGILYAIDKIENAADCDYFFNSDEKVITGQLVIDNPTILEELSIHEPIVVQGAYRVYENEKYRFIIIR